MLEDEEDKFKKITYVIFSSGLILNYLPFIVKQDNDIILYIFINVFDMIA